MKNIKIAFFDIDGTLLNFRHKDLTPNTLKTLQALKANDIKICIATGRGPVQVPKFKNISFDCYATFNGSYCFNDKGIMYFNPIDKKDIKTVINNAKNINRPVAIATSKDIVTNGLDDDLKEYLDIGNIDYKFDIDFVDNCKEDVYQILIGSKKEEYDSLIKNTSNVKITAWWQRALDIIPVNSGKDKAIKEILNYYHLTKDETIAFGDGNNDIDMIKAVGTGVAMGNASNKLKLVADDICLSVKEDGIYHYCLDKGLIL